MSRIDDLIAEYCPNGVERKPLGAIAKLYRGNGLQKKDFTDKGIGCIHYGQIYTRYDTFTSQTISFVDKKLADKLLKVHPNDLIVTATSENLEDVCKAVAWLGGSDIVTGGHSIVVRHHQNAKYLSYYFQTLDFFQRKRAYVHGTKVMEIKKDDLAKIVVPVPPLPVQEEIVRILDSFSSLEAELEARRKQYTHYRDELLKFERVLIASLGELCKISVGRKNGTAGEFGEYPYVNAGTSMSGFVNEWSEEGDCVTTPSRGQGGMGFVAYQASRFWCGPLCYVMRSKHSDVMIKYVYYYLCSHKADILGLVHEGGTPAINKSELAGLRILVPPFEEQQRIVSILDRFDKLTNDLSSGLPAEIEARHKQYEYYRDRLLSFDELAA